MADAPKIRIKLKAYDSRVIDAAAKQIVETALRSGASVVGPQCHYQLSVVPSPLLNRHMCTRLAANRSKCAYISV